MKTLSASIPAVVVSLLLAAQLHSQTVNSIFVGKGVENIQTDASTVIPNPQAPSATYGGAYGFQVSVLGTSLTAPTVTLAAGSTNPTTNASGHNGGLLGYNSADGEWAYGSPNFNNWGATSANEIDTLFAPGGYTVAVPTFPSVTVTLGTPLANISSLIANAPTFTLTGGNWMGGVYVVNVNQAVTITSNAFTEFGTGLDGHIGFEMYQNGGGPSVNNEYFYSDNNSADNFISYTINANTLISGQTYSVGGSFATVVHLDGTISGALVGAYMEQSTNFTISAVPEPSTYAMLAGVFVLGVVWWRRTQLV